MDIRQRRSGRDVAKWCFFWLYALSIHFSTLSGWRGITQKAHKSALLYENRKVHVWKGRGEFLSKDMEIDLRLDNSSDRGPSSKGVLYPAFLLKARHSSTTHTNTNALSSPATRKAGELAPGDRCRASVTGLREDGGLNLKIVDTRYTGMIESHSLFGHSPQDPHFRKNREVPVCISSMKGSNCVVARPLIDEIEAKRVEMYREMSSSPQKSFEGAVVPSSNKEWYEAKLDLGGIARIRKSGVRTPLRQGQRLKLRILFFDEDTDKIEAALTQPPQNSESWGDEVFSHLETAQRKKEYLHGRVTGTKEFVGIYVCVREGKDSPSVVGLLPLSSTVQNVGSYKKGEYIRVMVEKVKKTLFGVRLILREIAPELYDSSVSQIFQALLEQNVGEAVQMDRSVLRPCILVGVDQNFAYLRLPSPPTLRPNSSSPLIGILPISELPKDLAIGSLCAARISRIQVKRWNDGREDTRLILLSTLQDRSLLRGISKEAYTQLTDGMNCGWMPTHKYRAEEHDKLMEATIYHSLGYRRYMQLRHLRFQRHYTPEIGLENELYDKYGDSIQDVLEWGIDEKKGKLLTAPYLKHYWQTVFHNVKILDQIDLERVRRFLIEVRAELDLKDADELSPAEYKLRQMLDGHPIIPPERIRQNRSLSPEEKELLLEHVKKMEVNPIDKLDEIIKQKWKAVDPQVAHFFKLSKHWDEPFLPSPPPTREQMLLREHHIVLKRMNAKGKITPFPKELPFELQPGMVLIKKYESLLRQCMEGDEREDRDVEPGVVPIEAILGDTPLLKKFRQGDLPHGIPIPLPNFP